ncbi:MAG: DUF2442 domain-containing protein [Spirochaetales bacterium]|nr:DUF2442 domain-containing protein [Spirochaetales bacterium]
MFYDIITAEYEDDYKIKLVFEDRSIGIADLSDYPDPDNVFKAFLDINFFKNFHIQYGTLIWGNGELDWAVLIDTFPRGPHRVFLWRIFGACFIPSSQSGPHPPMGNPQISR